MRLPKRTILSRKKDLSSSHTHRYTKNTTGLKPDGLWYSCYDSWYRWILKEEMTSFLYPYIHKIRFRPGVATTIDQKQRDGTKMLVIGNVRDFDRFTMRYQVIVGEYACIDWSRVSKDYAGIEICPYLEKRRDVLWYSTWDVASGCIWNILPIVQHITLIYEKYHGKYKPL